MIPQTFIAITLNKNHTLIDLCFPRSNLIGIEIVSKNIIWTFLSRNSLEVFPVLVVTCTEQSLDVRSMVVKGPIEGFSTSNKNYRERRD